MRAEGLSVLTDRAGRHHRRRLHRLVDGLDLPAPFDAETFIAALAARRGRPIEILDVALDSPGPCGLLVATDRADYIVHTAHTTALHRQHILLHEAAHLLCGHDRTGYAASAAARALMPALRPALIRRVLGRTGYSEPQEREAELLASLIQHRALRAGPPHPIDGHGRAGVLVGTRGGQRARG